MVSLGTFVLSWIQAHMLNGLLSCSHAGKRKYKRTEYLSSDRLASVMDTFMTAASSRSVSPNDDAPASQLLRNQPTPAQPQERPSAQPQIGDSNAEVSRSPSASAQGISKAGTPVGSPLSPNRAEGISKAGTPVGFPLSPRRARLDPYEPLFAVEDEEDERALEEIEGMIQLILDVTPRRTEGRRKRSQLEALEVLQHHVLPTVLCHVSLSQGLSNSFGLVASGRGSQHPHTHVSGDL